MRIFWKRRIAARVTEGLHDEGRDGKKRMGDEDGCSLSDHFSKGL